MNELPLAYHITFGTYGTRLHGDKKGTIYRAMNKLGDPIIGHDKEWQRVEESNMSFDPIRLSVIQRTFVEDFMLNICNRGGWQYHVAAAQNDHIHVLLTSERDGQSIRMWLKRWLGEGLSEKWPLSNSARWFSKGGSVKWVWTQRYFDTVWEYVNQQRASGVI